MLANDGMTGHEAQIVLVTDGLENYAPFWERSGPHGSPLRPSFFGGDIRVDTIGIGGDADDALLTDVADATGGEFRNLNEGAGSFLLLSRLSSWYKAIDEDIRGEQRFFYQEGFPVSSSYSRRSALRKFRIGSFHVEPALDWMTVAFHASINNAATVSLYEPGSTSPIAITPPDVTYRGDAKHSVYRIRRPMAGVWLYTVEPKVLSAEFFAVASGPTSLSARMGPRQLAPRSGGDYSMPLRVWVADTNAVHNATVAGHVRRPDGVKDAVTLRDNGTSMDGGQDDGIYGVGYIASIPGAYYVDLKAAGYASNGEPFERYLSTAFYVPGQDKRPDQVGEGRPPRSAAGLCGGPAWCCWLWLAFLIGLVASLLWWARWRCDRPDALIHLPVIIAFTVLVAALWLGLCQVSALTFWVTVVIAILLALVLMCWTALVPCVGRGASHS
jgi:hypothetical protein